MLGMGPRFKGAMLFSCAWWQGVATAAFFPQQDWAGCGLCAHREHECCQGKGKRYCPGSGCMLIFLLHGSGQVAAPGV